MASPDSDDMFAPAPKNDIWNKENGFDDSADEESPESMGGHRELTKPAVCGRITSLSSFLTREVSQDIATYCIMFMLAYFCSCYRIFVHVIMLSYEIHGIA